MMWRVVRTRVNMLLDALFAVLFLMTCLATCIMVLERGDVTMDGARGDAKQPIGDRYSNTLSALQFSLIHLTGDYPMFKYRTGATCVQAIALFIGWAIVAVPSGIL